MSTDYPMVIGDEELASQSGRWLDVTNPATGEGLGRAPQAIAADVDRAMQAAKKGFDFTDPANVAPLVAWLASAESSDITGRVFEIFGGRLKVCEGWSAGPMEDKQARWDASELGAVVHALVEKAASPTRPGS